MPDGSNIVAPNLEVARQFCGLLTGSENAPLRLRFKFEAKDRQPYDAEGNALDPVDGTVLPRHPRTGKQRPPYVREHGGPLEALWPTVVDLQQRGYAVYYLVNVASNPAGTPVKDDDVTGIRSFFTDADNGLATEWHAQPSAIIHTSQGKGQALWFVTDAQVADFEEAQERLSAFYGTDSSVKNPSRVLRLPGSLHLKGTPQLVTYEDTSWGNKYSASAVLNGLPPLPPRTVSAPDGDPISLERLRYLLSGVSPYTRRSEWFPIVRAIANTPIIGEADNPDGIREAKRRLAHLWMAGDLYRRMPTAAQLEHLNGDFRDEEQVDIVFDAKTKDGGAGVGSIIFRGRAEGHDTNPEAWQAHAEAIKAGAFGDGSTTGAEQQGEQEAPWNADPDAEYRKLVKARRPKFYARDISAELRRPPPRFWDRQRTFLKLRGGSVSLIYARYSNAKTTYVTCRAVAIARETGAKILYCVGEGIGGYGPKVLRSAMKGWNDRNPTMPVTEEWMKEHFRLLDLTPQLLDPVDVDAMLDVHAEWHPDITVLDTYGSSMAGANLSDIGVATKANQAVRGLATTLKAGVWIVHHLGKDATRGPTGSQYIMNEVDHASELTLEPMTRRLQVEITKDRWGDQQDKKIMFGAETVTGLEQYDEDGNFTDTEGRYLHVFELPPGDPRHTIERKDDKQKLAQREQEQKELRLVWAIEDILESHTEGAKDTMTAEQIVTYLRGIAVEFGETDKEFDSWRNAEARFITNLARAAPSSGRKMRDGYTIGILHPYQKFDANGRPFRPSAKFRLTDEQRQMVKKRQRDMKKRMEEMPW